MGKFSHVEDSVWWDYLTDDLKELVKSSIFLAENTSNWDYSFTDYSFVVFPMAKAYEGFLKKFFLDMGFISEGDYLGTHFRIGKALNPHLEDHLKGDDWVYPKIATYCKGSALPKLMWNTWRECRNVVFHWFPQASKQLSFPDAEEKLQMILHTFDEVFRECRIKG
jgi:hypothetical protein